MLLLCQHVKDDVIFCIFFNVDNKYSLKHFDKNKHAHRTL